MRRGDRLITTRDRVGTTASDRVGAWDQLSNGAGTPICIELARAAGPRANERHRARPPAETQIWSCALDGSRAPTPLTPPRVPAPACV